jgi:hypothetical protein
MCFNLQGGAFEEADLQAEGEECSSDNEEVYYYIPLYFLNEIFSFAFPQLHGSSLFDSFPFLCSSVPKDDNWNVC